MPECPKEISIEDVKEASRKGDKHFFDEDTMRFFSSRVGQHAWKIGKIAYFITSEQFKSERYIAPRMYTVREMDLETGRAHTVGEFNRLSKSQAERVLKKLLKDAVSGCPTTEVLVD